MKKISDPAALETLRGSIAEKRSASQSLVSVCCGTGCRAAGALEVVSALEASIKEKKLDAEVLTKTTGCHGFCEQGPLVVVLPQNIFYHRVKPENTADIVEKTLLQGEAVEHLLYTDPATGEKVYAENEVPFYRKQHRLLMGQNGHINPGEIEDYIAIGGYRALAKALGQMDPLKIIEEVAQSGLRGRGGAGFSAGLKWKACFEAESDTKYVICNADEGDPGCFQDRSLLEGNPHSVLEGMIIGAFAVGAGRGYIYVRHEYPLAVKSFQKALEQAREAGLLGNNVLGSGFDFDVKIARGGGAFVCGEETALLSSIEEVTGEPNPRPRPPYPAISGLWGKPTVINNVKTWAAVPPIIEHGAGWFSSIGTEKSKGTMIFSLTGKVNNTGLVEVPMGITLKELIFDIGGGIPGGKEFKAVQTGGPAGGCIPADMLHLPIDFERLTEAGSMMGSGGLIVMDEGTCMVDVARYFLSFTQDESCGKCTPCREGGKQMLHLLEKITSGRGEPGDLDFIVEIAGTMKDASLCALGKLAPNPVLTTLKYYKEEYLAHIEEKQCPAAVCQALITFTIDPEICTGCGRCLRVCPVEAVAGEKKEPHSILQDQCTRCGACLESCRFDAISVK